ncbi:MAG TPA: carboxypeptidase regulatory-like domain-containing protein [Candidatus Acidoferrum sp.]|nr:carboxypeptidase regulatory-like domain-containing protein [Candidatus Acidoferrum sp.]
MKKAFRKSVVVFLMILGISGILLAQSDLGRISGFIKDPSGATVAAAKVTVRSNAGVERQTTTNESGYYVITNVPPGLYTMVAEATGFQKYQTTNNKLDPSADLVIDANLAVGAATQTVEVSASTVQLQTESASVQKVVTREQIDSLELNGRNPIWLAALVPGARGTTLANLNFGFTQGPANFNGSRNPENLITFDGAPATRTRSNGTSLGAADVDSTQEVQILTSNYSPEYGRTSGAQIRFTTKTGTSQFHGATYEYLRNTALNANTWARNANLNGLTSSAAPVHYNQFGYNVGGPIYIPGKFNTSKSKIFFYLGQEWLKYHFQESGSSVGSAGLLLVPSVKMRQGDFSELLDPNNPFVTRRNAAGAKIPVYVADPVSPASSQCGKEIPAGSGIISTSGCMQDLSQATPSNPQGFNIIPVNRLSTDGIGILNMWPVPNTFLGGGNWFAAKLHTIDQRKDTGAVDVNINDKQRLRFRLTNYTYLEYQPLDGNTDRTPKFFNRPNKTGSLNHVWTISPNKVNELLVTASEDIVKIPVDTKNFYDRTQACAGSTVPCGFYQYIFPVSQKLLPNRIPTVNLSSFSTLSGGPYPSHSAGPIYDASDSFTWIKSNHTLKFGFLWERSGENDNDEINVQACPTCTNNQNGQFSFTDKRTGGTGVAVANAALGLYDSYSEIGHRAYTIFRANMYESFAQDSWKFRQNLTFTYGLRYTVIAPYHALWGNMILFDPRFYDQTKAVTVDPVTGLVVGTIDPKTGLVLGTGADTLNGMVIPGSGFPSSAKNHFPEADPSQFDFSRLFHNVPNHYSDIQWGDIQPRAGFAYELGRKTVIRAGAGRFVTRLGVSDSIFLGGNPPFQPNASVANGVVDALGPGIGGNTALVVTTQSKAFKNPEAWAWNVTVERETFWKSLLSIGYVARRGVHLQRESDINQPTTAVVTNPANAGVNLNALRPFKGFGSIRETDNVANSIYNSLQIAWNRRFADGLQFGVSYTLSKSMDDGSNQRDVIPNTYDPKMLWGPSEFDARHILVFSYLYDVPIFKNRSNLSGKLLGGWQISGVTQFQTGQPCGAAHASDYAGVGLDSNFGCGVNGQYWNVNGTPRIVGTFGSAGQWFATKNPDGSSIFTQPPAGTFSTQRVRDLIYQPGFQNWNLGLFKSFLIDEQRGLQFRAEAFNFINHPNWGGGSGGGVNFDPTSSNFGKVTTKGGGVGGGERNLQLSLRFYF